MKPSARTRALLRAWENRNFRKFNQLIKAMSKEQTAEEFRKLRIAEGYSEEDLAPWVGLTARTVREWESGRRKRKLPTLYFYSLLGLKLWKPTHR